MTVRARWFIYALGGGFGHAVRGRTIQGVLEQLDQPTTLLISDKNALQYMIPTRSLHSQIVEVQDFDQSVLGREAEPHLIVDTFPHGIHGELSVNLMKRFSSRTLVARYTKQRPSAETLAHYDTIISPYQNDCDEWDTPLPGSIYGGVIRHDNKRRFAFASDKCLAIIDSELRLTAAAHRVLKKVAVMAGFQTKVFSQYPNALESEKVLFIGAGYNTFYEFLTHQADIRFIPVFKRWDDQHRRARMLGKSIENPADLLRWLTRPYRTDATVHTLTPCRLSTILQKACL